MTPSEQSNSGALRCRLFGHKRRVKFGRDWLPLPSWWALSGRYRVRCQRCGVDLGRFPPSSAGCRS